MRDWRRSHPLTPEQRRRALARSTARVYLQRGKLERRPCEDCGDLNAEMHHDDYDRPLDVRWLCRPDHLAEHRLERELQAMLTRVRGGLRATVPESERPCGALAELYLGPDGSAAASTLRAVAALTVTEPTQGDALVNASVLNLRCDQDRGHAGAHGVELHLRGDANDRLYCLTVDWREEPG